MSDRFSQNFGERLKFYGVQEPLQKSVSIDKENLWNDHNSPFELKLIRTKDLDEVKRLIGNDDKFFEGESFRVNEMNLARSVKEVTIDNLKPLASAYVFGNSQVLKHLKIDMEKTIGSVTVQVASAEDLIIKDVMTISGSDPKVIQAKKITFTDNGQIINEGILTINADTIVNLKR